MKNGGSWGGQECRSYIEFQIHIYESTVWLIIWILPYFTTSFLLRIRNMIDKINSDLLVAKINPTTRKFELFLCIIHFGLYLTTAYYKWKISSLINLVQPCHLILFLEGIALFSNSALGELITLFLLPVLSGTLLAIFFPDVSGLDQFLETELYWVQHCLILVVPIFLLSRRNFFALRFANAFTIYVGLSILGVFHFFFYEVYY